jgi:hypothetical protein
MDVEIMFYLDSKTGNGMPPPNTSRPQYTHYNKKCQGKANRFPMKREEVLILPALMVVPPLPARSLSLKYRKVKDIALSTRNR